MYAVLSYGLIVGLLGQDRGFEIANELSNDIVIKMAVLSVIVLLINYLLIKKMLSSKKPFLTGIIITVIGVIIFIPFFLGAKQSFIEYQDGTTQLNHYLDEHSITEATIISFTDTVPVKQLDDFKREIGYAKYKKGYWKYGKIIKIIFKRTDGSKDSISTNGQLFGPYKDKYFATDSDVIKKYLED
jgi:hypothetical protein